MLKFLQIYSAFFKQQIKSLIEYKADFMMGMIALSIQQISAFLVIFAVFTQIKAIGSYSFNEILLFYGFSQMVRGIDHVYNDNIWTVGWQRIRNGMFSQYMVRPINIISHIVMERVQFDGVGEVIIGMIIFAYAKIQLGLVFSLTDWLAFGIFIIAGLAIYFAIKLACAAVAFWTVSSGELMTVTYEINNFTKYPIDIYKNIIIKNILIYVLPFAVVSYFPMAYFIRDNKFISGVVGISYDNRYWLIYFIVLTAAISVAVSFAIWRTGIKRYNASGT